MSKALLITGATGKQGGAVIDALLSLPSSSDFTILAVTRDTNSGGAKKLAAKSDSIKLVQGNLDDIPELFRNATEVAKQPIWGVYSVQISMGKGVTVESEMKQGNGLIDESVKQGVKHFVYSSVERGGDEKSWNDPTPVGHFTSKYHIEQHLREAAGDKMGWTVLRPVAFMDNLAPGFPTKVFMTALRDTLAGKPLQWVATSDIGVFAAKAFEKPQEYNHKALGLAGDELDFDGLSRAFKNKTGYPAGTTFSMLGSALMWGVAEMGTMVTWFKTDGYAADIPKLRKIHPGLMNMETWLEKKSPFVTK
ncbi:hypothetical protein LTR04_004121 [Oleoguttula sp. CCFEE 6159]|nr:hypothetical protein LTR04_004121 [Oleoguttula sp. CCFEE 6159]